MRANFALPLILPWPRAMSTGNWYCPHNSLVVQSQSICTSCKIPNCSGPMPDPVTSVRLPHSAPAPKASCISQPSLNEIDKAPLQLLLGGESMVPGGRQLCDRRAGEVVGPPMFDDIFESFRYGPITWTCCRV